MPTPVPPGYRPLLLCDTRRARQWEATLRQEGIDALLLETTGADATKGAWQVAVSAFHEDRAKALVSSVAQGKSLRGASPTPSAVVAIQTRNQPDPIWNFL